MKKIDETGQTRRKGTGRLQTTQTDENIDTVDNLILSQESDPGTHLSHREIALETGISQTSVRQIYESSLIDHPR